MVGGEAEIGALWAAVTEGALFHIQLPGLTRIAASLGLEAQCFRGSVAVPGRKRPARHLLVLSGSARRASFRPATAQQ